LGTVDSATGGIALFVVNRNARDAQPASIRLTGFTPAADVKVWTLAAPSLLDKNDEEHQHAVRPVESHAAIEGGTLRHVFPAGSVTVFLFAGQRKR
jgi:alpha-L-arabinofuranosidase